MSPAGTLEDIQTKYLANGTRLGWLLNRKPRTVEIYRPNQPVETVERPTQLAGEDVLPGFKLQLSWIW
ncbi:MAG: Uma2 family endonuclease [Cyanobacteria bacterium J06626_18]